MKMKSIYRVVIAMLLAAAILLLPSGCSEPEQQDDIAVSVSDSQPEQEETDDSLSTETSVEDQVDILQESYNSDTKTVVAEEPDGSISILTTDQSGNLIKSITYDPASNTTYMYEYEYNENGVLVHEFNYSGEGDQTELFAAGNLDNANSWGEINYDVPGDYVVDIGHAFDVTIEELAPLYEKAGEIYDTYGVAVLIADKVCEWTDGAELCLEYKRIEDCLALTENCLASYPADFFRNLSDDGTDVTVCIQLVGTGSAAGLYMGGYNYPLIQMDVNCYHPEEYDDKGDFFSYTLHHEIFHMLGEKLLDRGAMTEEEWNSFNPDGFEYAGYYDDDKESELYLADNNSEYFIYSYSCSTPGEDRSIIFGNAMTYYQGYGDMSFTPQVKAKLRYLCDCMRAGFPSGDWSNPAPWECILYAD